MKVLLSKESGKLTYGGKMSTKRKIDKTAEFRKIKEIEDMFELIDKNTKEIQIIENDLEKRKFDLNRRQKSNFTEKLNNFFRIIMEDVAFRYEIEFDDKLNVFFYKNEFGKRVDLKENEIYSMLEIYKRRNLLN